MEPVIYVVENKIIIGSYVVQNVILNDRRNYSTNRIRQRYLMTEKSSFFFVIPFSIFIIMLPLSIYIIQSMLRLDYLFERDYVYFFCYMLFIGMWIITGVVGFALLYKMISKRQISKEVDHD